MNDVEPPVRLTMPPSAWPSPDRTAWRRANQPVDPFDPSVGRATLWREKTRITYQSGYGRWLAWLDATGQLDCALQPGERATKPRVRAFLQRLKEDDLADYTIAGHLMGLARVLHAMDPDGDFGWISTASRRLHGQARGVRDIDGKLRPVEDVLALAYELMWEAEHGRFRSDHERAVFYRDGLMIALQVHRALRLENLADIRLGEHLYRRGDEWRLIFSDEEMKQGRLFEPTWPEDLVAALERYLEVHREVLLDGRTKDGAPVKALWISRGANVTLAAQDVSLRIKKWTAEEFGVAINPHAFRHLVATTIATEDPEGVTAIAAVLGHATLETSETYYNKAKQVDAGVRYQNTLRIRRPRRPARRGTEDLDLFGE